MGKEITERTPSSEIKPKKKQMILKRVNKGDNKRCRNCQETGHFRRDCFEPEREKICPP